MGTDKQSDKAARARTQMMDELLAEHRVRFEQERNEGTAAPRPTAGSPQASSETGATTTSPRLAAGSPNLTAYNESLLDTKQVMHLNITHPSTETLTSSSPTGAAATTTSPQPATASSATHFGPPVREPGGAMDTLSVLFEMTHQQHLLLEADDRFCAFLRESIMAVEPTPGDNDGGAAARQVQARITDVQQAMSQALAL